MQRGWWGWDAKPSGPQPHLLGPNKGTNWLPDSQFPWDRMGRLLACSRRPPPWTRGQGARAPAAGLRGLRQALGVRDRKAPRGAPRPTAPSPAPSQCRGRVSASWCDNYRSYPFICRGGGDPLCLDGGPLCPVAVGGQSRWDMPSGDRLCPCQCEGQSGFPQCC